MEEPIPGVEVSWVLDCPAHGVAILDVEVGPQSPTPLHWRGGDWAKPPLDVRLNGEGGLESIQFVFHDESVEPGEAPLTLTSASARPVFDVAAWPQDRYRDARLRVAVKRLPSDLLYAWIGDSQPREAISLAGGLQLQFDTGRALVGIAVGPLSAMEWQLIGSAAPL